jgi:hypothetical protein
MVELVVLAFNLVAVAAGWILATGFVLMAEFLVVQFLIKRLTNNSEWPESKYGVQVAHYPLYFPVMAAVAAAVVTTFLINPLHLL